MKKKITLLLILSVFFTCFSALTANAKIWYVDAAAGPGGSGESWAEAFRDIQTAIDHADPFWIQCFAPKDKIYVKAGTYKLSATIDLDKVVSIYGGFPPAGNPEIADRNWRTYPTIIDGRNLRQCISARSSYFFIDGFTIRNGNAAINGGGLHAEKTPVYCSLTGYMSSVVKNCTFINNEALEGGAVYDGGADLKITDCRFLNNHSRSAGGAIFSSYGSPQISRCTFTGNTAVTNGGAICGYWANQTTGAVSYIINSVFHNNSANLGGAIHSFNFYPRIWNCTIYQNTAEFPGGGFHAFVTERNPADIQNSILWGNEPDQLQYTVSTHTYLKVDWCDIEGGWPGETNNINIDPGFAGPDDFHLTEGSPCIDAGRSFSKFSDDIEGVSRPQDGDSDGDPRWDIGAYEFEGYEPDSDKDGDVDGKDLKELADNFKMANLILFCDVFGKTD